ncbi:methyltransferase domain-containing protein [Paraburkholderia sp. CNPSo 3076]|uniref:class I SAM-dependent methyltransferase n=1 Tax=Paraburkholderia sp. CNPSo 3076 TaxID=2940936 RepID=UPI002253BD18|nr:class I SAM-dependent methyltransferase [Paraburkholderia sp. CNPSo 3076]MCX5543206.1 methyltransferase domain-containing protein [Paraburkholderia sp. CNPSo 3076]
MNTKSIDFFTSPSLPLPGGVSEANLFEWLRHVRVEGSDQEIENYLKSDFKRFVYTLGLVDQVSGQGGQALEFGSNPYFTTMLVRQFTAFDWSYSNYFGPHLTQGVHRQKVSYRSLEDGEDRVAEMEYHHFNSESDHFPFSDGTFDLVLYCEILEHLTNDPCKVLRNIRRVLKPDGEFILTTPNVARIENVMRLIDGANLYDPYSGYGPYGRHNREYTCDELRQLLRYVGFEVESIFTADVNPYLYQYKGDISVLREILSRRADDLGQYIFVRARKSDAEGQKLPSWLYRSVPSSRVASTQSDKIASLSADLRLRDELPGELIGSVDVNFVVANVGTERWEFQNLKLGARVINRQGDVIREFRGDNVGTVAPSQSVNLRININLTGLPNRDIEVVFDLVSEFQFWFENLGSNVFRVIQ